MLAFNVGNASHTESSVKARRKLVDTAPPLHPPSGEKEGLRGGNGENKLKFTTYMDETQTLKKNYLNIVHNF